MVFSVGQQAGSQRLEKTERKGQGWKAVPPKTKQASCRALAHQGQGLSLPYLPPPQVGRERVPGPSWEGVLWAQPLLLSSPGFADLLVSTQMPHDLLSGVRPREGGGIRRLAIPSCPQMPGTGCPRREMEKRQPNTPRPGRQCQRSHPALRFSLALRPPGEASPACLGPEA